MTQEYLNKNNKTEESGKFSWSDDGSIITLKTKDNSKFSYKVIEGRLVQLDQEGKDITGNLVDKFVLEKK